MNARKEAWSTLPGFWVPMDADHSKLCYQVWRSVPMMQLPLVSELPLLKTKDMVTIEDIRNDALPETTSQDTKQPQGEKHQQLGLEAGRKIVEALCTNLQEQQRGAFAFIDATAHTLEFAKACYLENAEKSCHCLCITLALQKGPRNMNGLATI